MKKIDILTEKYPEEKFLKADGFDEAIIGIDKDFRVCYSTQKCIDILEKDCASRDEASEYFWYNVAGAYVGDQTPIFVDELLV
tara:strand:- start:20 stop:268 length:249 start_codon:yes stop_codon:yes gene_type:complete